MFLFGKVTPETAVRSWAAALAAGATCDELSLLSALAEYLLIRPGITVADKASAVSVSVARDFFIVDILIYVLPFPKNQGGPFRLGEVLYNKDIHLPGVDEANHTYGNRQSLPVLHRFKCGK